MLTAQNLNTKTYWIVKVDKNKCSICEVCANRCPPNAISIKKIGDFEELLFDWKLCDGCNGNPYCQEHCPEKAIRITKKHTISKSGPIISLVKGEVLKCQNCGSSFVPEKKLKVLLLKPDIKKKEVHILCPNCRRKRIIKNLLV